MDPNKYVLKPHDMVGATLLIGGGLISATAILMVSLCIMIDIVRLKRAHPTSTWRLIQVPMDLYMISLFVADFIVTIPAVTFVYWAHSGEIALGGFCTAQGVTLRFGQFGLALSNLAITFHTVAVVWWRKGIYALRATKLIIAGIWLFATFMTIVLFTVMPNQASVELVRTPYYCWITPKYTAVFSLTSILPCMAIFTGILFSLPLYLSSRGIMVKKEDSWWKFTMVWPRSRNVDESQIHTLYLLLYPIGYLIVYFPGVIALQIWPSSITWSLISISRLCRLYDVILFRYMRSGLLQVKEVEHQSPQAQSDIWRLPQRQPDPGGWDLALSIPSEGEQQH